MLWQMFWQKWSVNFTFEQVIQVVGKISFLLSYKIRNMHWRSREDGMVGRPRLQNLCLSDLERAPYVIFSHTSFADSCILSYMQPSQHHRSEVYSHVGGGFPRRHWCPLKPMLQHRALDFGFPYDQFDTIFLFSHNLKLLPQVRVSPCSWQPSLNTGIWRPYVILLSMTTLPFITPTQSSVGHPPSA